MKEDLIQTVAPRPEPLTRAALPKGLWSEKTTFRHGQCDPAGIVYTPNFFDVFNKHIEQWFSAELGIVYYDLIGERRTGLGYVSASSLFFIPCKMGEEIETFIDVAYVGGKSYSLTLHAMKGDQEALRGSFTTVTTCLETHRPIAIPADLKEALLRVKGQGGE